MRREIIICADRRDGDGWVAANAPVGESIAYTYATPRSPNRVRGLVAHALHVTERMHDHPKVGDLQEVCAPALYTTSK